MQMFNLIMPIQFASIFKAAQFALMSALASFSFSAHSAPQDVVFGSYVTSVYNVDSDRSVFSADVWVWSKSKLPFQYKIKESLDVSYLSSQYRFLSSGELSEVLPEKTFYSLQKIQGTFLHDFDLAKFPFDRQKLTIYFEDSSLNLSELKFSSDIASGYDSDLEIDGWTIVKVSSKVDAKKYKTDFGVSTKPADVDYSRVGLEITIKRASSLIFFKITLGLFAAVLVAMFSTFMNSDSDDLYSARLGLLGATLLAVVVNQQFADSKVGQTTTVTLIDSLHMLGFIIVFLLFIATIFSRKLHLAPILGLRPVVFDRTLFGVSLSVFSLLSLFLIWSAVIS